MIAAYIQNCGREREGKRLLRGSRHSMKVNIEVDLKELG
jgi:hypothetical protein